MSLVALPARGACREMLPESGPCRRARVVGATPCSRKKRARETAPAREAFDVRKEVFAVGKMSGKERSFLRKRFQRELVAVRGFLKKLAVVPEQAVEGGRGAAPSSSPPAAPRVKDGRSEEPIEADKSKTAKRRKTSPPPLPPPPAVDIEAPPPKMTPAEREELAFSLAALSAELSPDTVTLLKKKSHGRRGEVVVDANSMGDAALLELKLQLDKFFVKTKSDLPIRSSPQDEGKIVDDEGKNDLECVEICGGVAHSRATIAPSLPHQLEILDQCGDIFAATGVDKLLSPLPQKYLALAEKVVAEEEDEEEYVDICGDASPVVILQNPVPIISRSTSTSSSTDSDSDSDGSDSSDSGSGSDSCPAAPAKVNGESGRQTSEPAREAVQNAEPEKVSSPPASAQEVVQNAEPEKVSSPSAPVLPLPKANGDSEALPSEPAKKVTQNAEAEKMSNSPAPVLLLPKANGDSAKQLDVVQQNAEQEMVPVNHQSAAAPPVRSMSELIAEAQEKRWLEEMSRAREKARQELVETERSAMTSDRVHPLEMEELGIAQIEHIVSDIAQQQTLLHGVRPGLLQKLGLFLKADDDGDGGEQQQTNSVTGDDDDLEEGEIR